jgi:hypothetical protein
MLRLPTLLFTVLLLSLSISAQQLSPEGVWVSNEDENYTFRISGSQLEMRRDYCPARRYLGPVNAGAKLIANVKSPSQMGSMAPEDICAKILQQRGAWPLRIDFQMRSGYQMDMLVYFNQVSWDEGTREVTDTRIDAGTVPITLEREWRWKPSGKSIDTQRAFRLQERASIIEDSDTGHGVYNEGGRMFEELIAWKDMLSAARKLKKYTEDGKSALAGELEAAKSTIKSETASTLASKSGIKLPPTSLTAGVEAYIDFLFEAGKIIEAAGARLAERAAKDGTTLKPKLPTLVMKWTCAEIEVKVGDAWVAGGWKMKGSPSVIGERLLEPQAQDQQRISNLLSKAKGGSPKHMEHALSLVESWVRRYPGDWKRQMAEQERACEVPGLCRH